MTDAAQQFLCRATYLIDSFWEGKLLELNNLGNIKVAGTNGAGKTTLLKLPMLFWGARPGRIVERNANKKSFAAYYLPRKTSYIIFDYQRPNGTDKPQLCHVLIKSDGEKLQYRFIDHPFENAMYLDDDGTIFSDDKIKSNYRQTYQCQVSSLLSVDDYAKVIQNHRDLNGKKHLRALQQRFSMSNSPVKHVEKVVTSVFNKISNFDVIKQMIIEISQDAISSDMLSNGVNDMVNINKEDIDSWLADLHSSQSVLALEDKIIAAKADIESIIEIEKELGHLHYLALAYQEKCALEQTSSETRLSDVSATLAEKKKAFEHQEDQIEDGCREEEKALRDVKHIIDQLEQEKIDFEDDEAATYEQRAAELNDLSLRLINLKTEKTELSEKSADLSRSFAEKKQEQTLSFTKKEQQLDSQIASQTQQLSTELSQNELHYSKLEAELRTQIQQQVDALNLKMKPLTHRQIELGYLIQQPQIDNELREQSSKIQQSLQQTRRTLREHQEAFNRLNNETHLQRQKQQQALLDNDRLKAELNQLAQQHRDVLALLSPAKGSLHAFFAEHVPEWQSTIGRVINPDLLKQLHLEPELTESNPASSKAQPFNGIKLNMAALETVSFTDQSLAAKELDLTEKMAVKQQQLAQLQADLEQLNQEVENLDKQLMSSKQLLYKQQQLQDTLVEEEDALNVKITQQQALCVERTQTELAEIGVQIANLEKELKQTDVDYQSRHNELNNQRLGVHCQLETDFNQRIENFQSSLDALRIDSAAEIARLDVALQAALSEAGINASIFNALEDKITHTAKSVEQAKQYQQKARDYQHWLDVNWSQIEPSREQHRRLEVSVQTLQQALAELKTRYQQENNQLNQEKQQLEQRINELSLQLKGLAASLLKLDDYAATEHDELPTYSVTNIAKLTNSQHSALIKQAKNVSDISNKLNSELKRYSGSTLHNGWLEHQNTTDNDVQNYLIRQAINSGSQLNYVLSSAKLLQTSTTHEVELRANDILSIHTHLSNFDRNISRTGRKLSSHMNGKQFFTALGDISIAIKTKMDKLGFWTQLENVQNAFTEYKANTAVTHDRRIPQSLIDSLDELSTALPKSSNMMQHNDLFDIEFTITENGRVTRATTPKELEDVSSTGLSYLALITFFTGLTTMLRPDSNTVITWPVDELGELHAENIQAMLNMLNDQGIQIMTASPSTDKSVLQLFDHLYEIDNKNKRLIQMNVDDDPLMALLSANSVNSDPVNPDSNDVNNTTAVATGQEV